MIWLLITFKSTKHEFIEETHFESTKMNVTHSKQSQQTLIRFYKKRARLLLKAADFVLFYAILSRRINLCWKLKLGCENGKQLGQFPTLWRPRRWARSRKWISFKVSVKFQVSLLYRRLHLSVLATTTCPIVTGSCSCSIVTYKSMAEFHNAFQLHYYLHVLRFYCTYGKSFCFNFSTSL